MYTDYFGFRGEPFTDTADLDCFYTNAIYQKAYATLLNGIREDKGFLLLTGEAGTGKTTLIRRLMKDVSASGHYVFFDSTSLASATIDDLLYFICAELGLHGGDNGRVEKLRMFSAYLNTLVDKGKTEVLLVDEAQHLNDEVLGGLRTIMPLDMKSERLLLQVVLIGQPDLERRLEQPNLLPIQQRVALRCRLDRLKDEEIPAYIYHRLQAVGCERQDLFAAEALQRIVASSYGVPRLINIICDNALRIAYRAGDTTVSEQSVAEAVEDLRIGKLIHAGSSGEQEDSLPRRDRVPAALQLDTPPNGVVTPFYQQDEPNGADVINSGIGRPRRVTGYLIAGILLTLGAGIALLGQRGPLSFLFPPQPPVITRVHPNDENGQVIVLPEGQSQTFTVETASAQSDSLQYTWLVNGQKQGSGTSWAYQPQFNEGGQVKTVTVQITNSSQQTAERHWTVQITDVNRPPQIVNVAPRGPEVMLRQGGPPQSFAATVEDPDPEQQVEIVWILDGQQVAHGPQWTFVVPPTMDEGTHSVKMKGTDSAGASVEQQWVVTVLRDIPQPPHITRKQPANTAVTIVEGQETTFAVEVENPHPEIRYVWLMDGQERARGNVGSTNRNLPREGKRKQLPSK